MRHQWLVAGLFACGLASLVPFEGAANQRCRIFAATYQTVSRSAAFNSTITGSCRFDPARNETTCINDYRDSMGGTSRSTAVTAFAARADAIDEVRVVPPLRRSTGTVTTATGSNGTTTSTLTNTYDAQRRLVRETGNNYTTTYTAWDAAGRPTAATSTNNGQTLQMTMVYDDAARTLLLTTSGRGFSQACTSTFDVNGTNISNVCGSGATAVTATTTIQTTAQVCP